VRQGYWKLVVGNGGSGQLELYHLATDIGESKDLAAEEPDKVKAPRTLWDRWNAERAPASAPREPAQIKRQKKRVRE
jgi:hypothetical protein